MNASKSGGKMAKKLKQKQRNKERKHHAMTKIASKERKDKN